jgi:hypothetical protein
MNVVARIVAGKLALLCLRHTCLDILHLPSLRIQIVRVGCCLLMLVNMNGSSNGCITAHCMKYNPNGYR